MWIDDMVIVHQSFAGADVGISHNRLLTQLANDARTVIHWYVVDAWRDHVQ